MRLTTKGRFAVTAMIDLGLRQSSGPVTLAAISQRQQMVIGRTRPVQRPLHGGLALRIVAQQCLRGLGAGDGRQ